MRRFHQSLAARHGRGHHLPPHGRCAAEVFSFCLRAAPINRVRATPRVTLKNEQRSSLRNRSAMAALGIRSWPRRPQLGQLKNGVDGKRSLC